MVRFARTALTAALTGGMMLAALGPGAQAAPGGSGGSAPTGGHPDPVPELVRQAQGVGVVVALTVDDGPNPGETDALLDLLAVRDIRAVFCVIGQNITAPGGAELLRRIVDDGHVLCNHTTSYADMAGWESEEIRQDLTETLEIIRDALDDPQAPVPFFRAPNGSWGQTPEVAVELGMQPLAVVNTIADCETQDEQILTENLREAIVPGELVLVHDGGGDRWGTISAVETVVTEKLADGWEFTLPVGIDTGDDGEAGAPGPGTGGGQGSHERARHQVVAGDERELRLDGLPPRTAVELLLSPAGARDEASVLGAGETDAHGAADLVVTVPEDAAPGRHEVIVMADGDQPTAVQQWVVRP
ncbi:polysaccharide deacetylase family protein [Nesterenkonia sp. PF2B19]|uniref:polysaccharide deacetylase family protein n=1 Tax=Nesterenkonia sp. PF2B19 TaxID=1881858 RepID=UPI00191C7A0F|nr:polysaccharide deacetylase family protein [Nesterenkonia sp. PF2B19]